MNGAIFFFRGRSIYGCQTLLFDQVNQVEEHIYVLVAELSRDGCPLADLAGAQYS